MNNAATVGIVMDSDAVRAAVTAAVSFPICLPLLPKLGGFIVFIGDYNYLNCSLAVAYFS